MVAPISPVRRRLLRRPAPHCCPNLDLSHHISKGVLGWSEWRRLHGSGVRSWFRWLGSALTMLTPSQAESNWLKHQEMLDERRCHSYQGMTWCFCERRA